jgi:hypothetical protein
MTQLTRFLLKHALIGASVAVVFVTTLLAMDVAQLGSLMARSGSGGLAAAVLTFATALTFGSVQMGFAVMLMTEDAGTRGGRRAAKTLLTPSPVRVAANVTR